MELPFEDWSNTFHSFSDLASIIQTTHDAAQSSAVRAINRMQTMRNWLIGYYIVEFEQHGKDRAEYGTQLLKKLEEQVNRKDSMLLCSRLLETSTTYTHKWKGYSFQIKFIQRCRINQGIVFL